MDKTKIKNISKMIPSNKKLRITFVLPTFNERNNIVYLIKDLLKLVCFHNIEILVVDDNSNDGTSEIVRTLAQEEGKIRLVNRIGRFGLSSAIKEGCLNATNEIIAIMDTDGQHQVKDVINAVEKLSLQNLDIVSGSRFLSNSSIKGLSQNRTKGSQLANKAAKLSLSQNYSKLSDYMSGCIVLKRKTCIKYIEKIDVNGFKFLYELLSLSNGNLKVGEIPLSFQSRKDGFSKFDFSILWDFLISLCHTFLKRAIPRKAISFAGVGATGIIVQLFTTYILMFVYGLSFQISLPIAVVTAASSNFSINNWLTFRSKRLKNKKFLLGLLKFLLISSLPIIANVGVSTTFYKSILPNTLLSQLAGIVIVFIWNYAASSKFVWDS